MLNVCLFFGYWNLDFFLPLPCAQKNTWIFLERNDKTKTNLKKPTFCKLTKIWTKISGFMYTRLTFPHTFQNSFPVPLTVQIEKKRFVLFFFVKTMFGAGLFVFVCSLLVKLESQIKNFGQTHTNTHPMDTAQKKHRERERQ